LEFEVSAATATRARTLIERAQQAQLGGAGGRHPKAVAAAAPVVAVADDGRPRTWTHSPGEVAAAIEPTALTLKQRREEIRGLLEESSDADRDRQ